jgi:hypothetical protein
MYFVIAKENRLRHPQNLCLRINIPLSSGHLVHLIILAVTLFYSQTQRDFKVDLFIKFESL